MSLGIVIAIAAIIIAATSGFLIKRQSCINNLNRFVQNTIESVNGGRNHKVAIGEDFAEHEGFVLALLPYLLFASRRRTEQALKNYSGYHKAIKQLGPATFLGSTVRSEIDVAINHLQSLKKKF